MKSIIATLLLFSQFSFAQDIPLGPVTAVKRSISGIKNDCMSNLLKKADEVQSLHACRYSFLKNETEFSPSDSKVQFADKECMAEINLIKGSVFVTFGLKARQANALDSAICLDKVIEKIGPATTLQALVYTTN